jgi:hypothetical protein
LSSQLLSNSTGYRLIEKIKIIYIAGETRSGSTILSNILGGVNGFFNAGELIEFWDTGLIWPCSCGALPKNCKIWLKVINQVLSSKVINTEDVVKIKNKAAHSKNIPKFLLKKNEKLKSTSDIGNYLAALNELYKTIQCVTNSRVIIDASKNVGYGYLLGLVPELDIYNVHLIRDARATAYSWIQKKPGLWTQQPTKSSLRWLIRNFTADLLGTTAKGNYLRIHYEDFTDRPIQIVNKILKLIKEPHLELPFIDKNKVQLGKSHGICGNPDRFQNGVVKLKLDQRWREMSRRDKIIVSLITWPLLAKYGYPIFPKLVSN